MIGFDDIVEIFDLPMRKLTGAFAFGFQFCNRDAVSWSLVGVDRGWLFAVLQAVQGLAQKTLGRFGIAGRR